MPGTRTRSKCWSRPSGLMSLISIPDSLRTRLALRALKTMLSNFGASFGERISASVCATRSASAGPERLDSMQPSSAIKPRRKVFLVIDQDRADIRVDPVQGDRRDVQRDIAVGLVAARAHRNVLRESGRQGRHRWGDELRLSVLVLADKPQAIRYRLRAAAVLGVVADLDFVAAQRLQLPAMGMLLQRRRVLAI